MSKKQYHAAECNETENKEVILPENEKERKLLKALLGSKRDEIIRLLESYQPPA